MHQFLLILNPFAPHISEELNEMIGFETLVNIPWPEYDESLTVSNSITIAVQINGKTRGTVDILVDTEKKVIYKKILENKRFNKYLEGVNIKRKIYVPNRLINILTS